MRNIFSFVLLKEGLEVHRTCRQLHNDETANSIFRYCYIIDYARLCARGRDYSANYSYICSQRRIVCNTVSLGNLRAVLRNETLPLEFSQGFIQLLTTNSATDNAQAMAILLQDSQLMAEATVDDLDEAIKKSFAKMAALLLELEHIKANAQSQMLHATSAPTRAWIRLLLASLSLPGQGIAVNVYYVTITSAANAKSIFAEIAMASRTSTRVKNAMLSDVTFLFVISTLKSVSSAIG